MWETGSKSMSTYLLSLPQLFRIYSSTSYPYPSYMLVLIIFSAFQSLIRPILEAFWQWESQDHSKVCFLKISSVNWRAPCKIQWWLHGPKSCSQMERQKRCTEEDLIFHLSGPWAISDKKSLGEDSIERLEYRASQDKVELGMVSLSGCWACWNEEAVAVATWVVLE
jgi:hypothetical protein